MLIVSLIIGALLVYAAICYNRLIKSQNLLQEGWSGIDVQLKLRHDLIPNLVSIVKGYSKHESETLESVVLKRTQASTAVTYKDAASLAQTESSVSGSLRGLLALSEDYPDLKANQSFLDLQTQLSEVEDQIQYARRYYNGCVREYNLLVQTIPSSLFAKLFGFTSAEFFELEDMKNRNNPEVHFA